MCNVLGILVVTDPGIYLSVPLLHQLMLNGYFSSMPHCAYGLYGREIMHTTRSGYVWLLKRAEMPSSPPAIWAKIRVFAWRACHDGLPTFGNHLSSQALHDNILQRAPVVAANTTSLQTDFVAANVGVLWNFPAPAVLPPKWHPPVGEGIKINVDGRMGRYLPHRELQQ
ncbi:hypothetical protein V6N13_078470 [Hibiscus sabdariffa]